MCNRGYIFNRNGKLIETFRSGNPRGTEFGYIFSVDFSKYTTNQINPIQDSKFIRERLRLRIQYYLDRRNNEKPDYGIEWKSRFSESEMFNKIDVLGKEMNLFSGNEDNLICFLANIQNHFTQVENDLFWTLTINDREFRETIKNLKIG